MLQVHVYVACYDAQTAELQVDFVVSFMRRILETGAAMYELGNQHVDKIAI